MRNNKGKSYKSEKTIVRALKISRERERAGYKESLVQRVCIYSSHIFYNRCFNSLIRLLLVTQCALEIMPDRERREKLDDLDFPKRDRGSEKEGEILVMKGKWCVACVCDM